MDEKIHFRAVLEVLGKPKEHVEGSLKNYVKKITDDEKFTILNKQFAEIKKQEEQELWATFAELDIETSEIENLTHFCFEYMPSLLEIISPKKLPFKDIEVSSFLNDLQARLHQVDMVAKTMKMERDQKQQTLNAILKNYITILLKSGKRTAQELSVMTGIRQEELEDFLDALIDTKNVDLDGEHYYLVPKNGA